MRESLHDWFRVEGRGLLAAIQRYIKRRPHRFQMLALAWLIVSGIPLLLLHWIAFVIIGVGPIFVVMDLYFRDDVDYDFDALRTEGSVDDELRSAPKPHGDVHNLKNDEWEYPWL